MPASRVCSHASNRPDCEGARVRSGIAFPIALLREPFLIAACAIPLARPSRGYRFAQHRPQRSGAPALPCPGERLAQPALPNRIGPGRARSNFLTPPVEASSPVPLGSIVHPRRMFRIYDRLGEYLRAWKRNRESERQRGSVASRETLPVPYSRRTPAPVLTLGTDEAHKIFTEQTEEMEVLQFFAAYWALSRQIFSFDPALTAALRRTDVADIPWGEILLPHKEFYLAFPHEENPRFTLDRIEYVVDGAYVLDATGTPLMPGRVFAIRIVARPVSETTEALLERDLQLQAAPMITCLIGAKAEETVATALNNGAFFMAKDAERQDRNLGENMVRLMATAPNQAGQTAPPVYFRGRHAQTAPVVEEVLPLIINSIFYLCQRPEDAEQRFEADAPATLVTEATDPRVSDKAKRRAEGQLGGMGFSRINFVVNRDLQAAARNASAPTGRQMPVHLRRGHWHRYAHGPGKSLWKWLFVAPVLVNAARGALDRGADHAVQ